MKAASKGRLEDAPLLLQSDAALDKIRARIIIAKSTTSSPLSGSILPR